MKRWTDTEYVDAYQIFMPVPGIIVSYEDHKQALAEKDREIERLKHEYVQLKEAYDAKSAGVRS